MNAHYTVFLLLFVVALAVLLIRYVSLAVDREFRNLALAVEDEAFRRAEIARVDELLSGKLPLPSDVKPLAGRESGGRQAFASALLILGVILLWGAGSARDDVRAIWLYGGVAAFLVAAAAMLLGLSRRKWARVARLLLFRADLKRLDGDREGAATDLHEALRIAPWDDSSWAEYADDLAATGRLSDALEAVKRASAIDPKYDEYRMVAASLAIRTGRIDEAREAVRLWMEIDRVEEDDPRVAVYQAALQLAEGNRDKAKMFLDRALLDKNGEGREFLDSDQALDGVRDLLPGRT